MICHDGSGMSNPAIIKASAKVYAAYNRWYIQLPQKMPCVLKLAQAWAPPRSFTQL